MKLPLDAFPDITPNQVQINAVAPALSAEEVERQITFPVELAMGGLKGLDNVRSSSKFGLSQVVATFDDQTNVYFARQQINERLQELKLPDGIDRPFLGPVATGLGEVYHFLIWSDVYDLMELRLIQDWVVRPRLRRVPGVAEVSAWGGLVKQFEGQVDPSKLAKYSLTLDDVIAALRDNNLNVGAGKTVRAGATSVLQGIGRLRTLEQIGDVTIKSSDGIPIRVRDIGTIAVGHGIRRGAATAAGKGEVVLGQAFMRMGENSRSVTAALDRALDDARTALPPGVHVDVLYRRTDLVNSVLETAQRNLMEGAVLVIAVLFAFLGNLRAGLIVASAIPLSMLFAVTMMQRIGIMGSLMSLGAIDFGLIVDSSVVMVENCVRRLNGDEPPKDRLRIIRSAAIEVRRPTMFGELIIMIVYLPILTLEGVEGKLFRPMALTVIFALAGSLLLSLTLMPVLASYGLGHHVRSHKTLVDRIAHSVFQPILQLGLRFPRSTLFVVAALTLSTAVLGMSLGAEFIPRLSEGTICITTIKLPSVSLSESARYDVHIEELLKEEFPDEIRMIAGWAGSAEIANDQMGPEVTDTFVMLHPRERWTKANTQEELVERMSEFTERLPGVRLVYTQPIEMRVNEMDAGIRTDVGIKIYGEDLDILREKAEEIEKVVRGIPGAADVGIEQTSGLPIVSVTIDQAAIARHNVSSRQVLESLSTIGGVTVGEVLEAERRFPLVVRASQNDRLDPHVLEEILVPTATGDRLPLKLVTKTTRTMGPSTIIREWGLRRSVVQANIRGRDIASFVEDAQQKIAMRIVLPVGYSIEWGGQFEHLQRAQQRLILIVPAAMGMILCLLYLTLNSLRDAFMIFSGVLFARIGGILGLWVMGLPFTISAGVGFVALAGASMLEGLILVSTIRDRMSNGASKKQAIEEARLSRLRPVLMTGLVAALGFVPMMLSKGIGSEVQRPLATVVVFGMACDTFLTMLALPVLYLLFGEETLRSTARSENCRVAES